MSNTVDSRVVEMRFDNKHFEENVATSMSTLDKLKQGLKLDGATKGLENVNAASKKVDFSGMTGAIEQVGLKFNAMYTIADQVFRNLTNSAMYYGKRIVSAIAIDPIKTGLSEYETQINAVQTILANTESKGSTLEDVNGALDELNTYADKTIYNFTEMTRNIGTFTAAGVDLDTSVNAIQGIANLAAVSGSNSQQASTAMYQLSQALSSGTVKLMDWNSVVNAGMGGQVFQDALKETARVHGVAIDDMIDKNGSFRETLQEGWLTADILTETLSHFTMAAEEGSEQWKEYKKTLMDQGYTEDQANAILKMSNTATDAATKVKTATQLWDTLKETAQSGWTQTWEIIMGDFEEAKELFSDLYATLAPIIEASSAARNELLKGWKDAGGRTHIIDSLYNVFEGIGNIVKPIKEAFNEIFPPTTVDQLLNITEGLKNLTESFKNLFAEGTGNADNLKRTFKGIFAAVDIVKEVIFAVFKLFAPLFGKVDDLGGGVLGVTAKIGDFLVKLRDGIKEGNLFEKAIEKIHSAFGKVGKFLKPIVDGIKSFGKSIGEVFTGSIDNAEKRLSPLAAMGTFIKSVFEGLGKIVAKIAPFVTAAATAVGRVLGDLMGQITSAVQNADYDKVFDLANGGLITTIGIFIAKFINSGSKLFDSASGMFESVSGFGESVKEMFSGVSDALGAFTESQKAETLKKVAISIGILAAALLVLSLIDSEKLGLSMVAMTVMFQELMWSVKSFNKLGDTKGLVKISAALIGMASALLVLSIALKIMSTMSWSEMGVGLISMTVGLGALVGAVNLLPESKVNKAAKAMKQMASAILILALGIKIMSTMSWEEMGVGLISMVVGLGALVAAVNLLPKDTAIRAAGMVGLATAMVILSAALKIMASMSWDEVARSLVTLSVSLGVLAGAMALMKKGIPGAAAMLIIAPALVVLAGALKIMATMSWVEIAKGLVVLTGALLMISAAMAMMKTAIPGAAALLIVAAALLVLTPVLKSLGSMSWGDIARGLVALAGAFTVIGLAGLLLKPLIGTITKLSIAMALFGAGCAAVGVGVALIGVGLTAVATAIATTGGAIVVFISSLISLIPYLIEQIGVGIVKFLGVISGAASAICDAVAVIIVAVVDAIVAAAPSLVEGALVLITEFLKSLAEHAPVIVGALFDFLVGVINALAEKLPDLIQACVNLLMALFSGVVEALKSIDPNVLINGLAAIGVLTAIIAAMAAVSLMVPSAMAGVLGMAVVVAELAVVLAAFGALSKIPGLQELISDGGNFLQAVGTAIGQFLGGLVGGVAKGMSASLPQVAADLSTFMTNITPFVEGAKAIDPSTMDGVKALVDIITTITAIDVVDSSMGKFTEDLIVLAGGLNDFSAEVAGVDAAAITAAASAAKALAEMTAIIPNEGGVASWFAGENSISKFGGDLKALGTGLKDFATEVSGVDPATITAAAGAAKTLAEMTAIIPNEGGVASWFAGENSISKFGGDLKALGTGLKDFATEVAGVDPAVITAVVGAAKALVDMTTCIPNEGGVASWFAGENSISKFGEDLKSLGTGLKNFSTEIAGIDPAAMTAAASAAKALADMTACIPNEGGVASWFAGENSVSRFAGDLKTLGTGLKNFSTEVAGVDPATVTAAAGAAKAIAEMSSVIPNEGGVVAWFTGDNSLSKFAGDLKGLGTGIKNFATEVDGIKPENVVAAANAAKALAEMASVIPNEGGVVAWFTGDNSMSKFAEHLPSLGKGLKKFSDELEGISATNITTAANAAKSLAEMTKSTPGDTSKLVSFGDNLKSFGAKLKAFAGSIKGTTVSSIAASTKAIESINAAVSKLDSAAVSSAASSIENIVDAIKDMASINESTVTGFSSAMNKLGQTGVQALIKSFEDAYPNLTKVGQTSIDKISEGAKGKGRSLESTFTTMLRTCVKAISGLTGIFEASGGNVVKGFARGITRYTYLAEARSRAMARAAADAAREELDEHSPSRVFDEIGDFAGVAFVDALASYADRAYNAGAGIANSAREGISRAVRSLKTLVDGEMNTQPTIRPVLDLSDVRAGANSLNGILSARSSVGVLANIGAISTAMNQRNQNGTSSDVVSAINKLRKDMGNVRGDTYNINGVTYDDGSTLAGAVKEIVRVARVERRR